MYLSVAPMRIAHQFGCFTTHFAAGSFLLPSYKLINYFSHFFFSFFTRYLLIDSVDVVNTQILRTVLIPRLSLKKKKRNQNNEVQQETTERTQETKLKNTNTL